MCPGSRVSPATPQRCWVVTPSCPLSSPLFLPCLIHTQAALRSQPPLPSSEGASLLSLCRAGGWTHCRDPGVGRSPTEEARAQSTGRDWLTHVGPAPGVPAMCVSRAG